MTAKRRRSAPAFLARYQPRSLTPAEWALARDPVLHAVRAAEPKHDEAFRLFVSRLCDFLGAGRIWDRTGQPDLRGLLTETAIERYDEALKARRAARSSRAVAGANLRRIRRGLAGSDPIVRRRTQFTRPAAIVEEPDMDALLVRARRHGQDGDAAAVALTLQVGLGLPPDTALTVAPDAADLARGTVRVAGTTLPVLADVADLLPRAVTSASGLASSVRSWQLLTAGQARATWMLAQLRAETPLSVLHHATVTQTGDGLRRNEIERLFCHLTFVPLDEIAASAADSAERTVPAEIAAAARVLAKVPTAAVREAGDVPSTAPQGPSSRTPSRRMSRAALLRAARQAHDDTQQTHDPLHLHLALTDHPAWPQLTDEVRARILAYRPTRFDADAWTAVQRIARRLMAAAKPTTVRKVNVLGSHLAWYLTWARTDMPDSDELELARAVLDETTLDRWTTSALSDVPDGTRSTRRSEVRGALRAARPGPKQQRIQYRPVRPPYTPGETAAHVRLARNQPTRARRRALSVIVGAGLGAGMDGRDMRWLRPCDTTSRILPDGTEVLAVQVRGDRPRVVVVRDEYAALLREAIELHLGEGRGRRQPLLGRKGGRKNVTAPVFAHATTADGSEIPIEVARLRSTWLVNLMSAPVPLGVLLAAAGLRSARPLADLLPFTTPPDDETVIRLLRAKPGTLLPQPEAVDGRRDEAA